MMETYKGFTNEELVILAQEGCVEARQQLVTQNKSFIHMMAQKTYNPSDPTITYEDAYHNGVIGYLEAIDRFDTTKGYTFNTYAGVYVYGKVNRANELSTKGKCFRIGRDKRHQYSDVIKKKTELQQELLRNPTNQELADAAGIDIKKLDELLVLNQPHHSIFETTVENERSDGDDKLLVDFIESNEPNEEQIVTEMTITDLIGKLPILEQTIIILSFYEGYTQKDIAEIVGCGQSKICKYMKLALEHLREMWEEL